MSPVAFSNSRTCDDEYGMGPPVSALSPPIGEDSCEVSIVTALSPSVFFIQLEHPDSKVHMSTVSHLIEQHAAVKSTFTRPPLPGTVCLALFEDDGNWYRACVITRMRPPAHVHDTPVQKVFFIDYGNFADVTLDQLRKLDIPPEVAMPPGQAILVGLAEVIPKGTSGKWSAEALQNFVDHMIAPFPVTFSRLEGRPSRLVIKIQPSVESDYLLWIIQNLNARRAMKNEWQNHLTREFNTLCTDYDEVMKFLAQPVLSPQKLSLSVIPAPSQEPEPVWGSYPSHNKKSGPTPPVTSSKSISTCKTVEQPATPKSSSVTWPKVPQKTLTAPANKGPVASAWTMEPGASQPSTAVNSHGSSVSGANTVPSSNSTKKGLKSSQSSKSVTPTTAPANKEPVASAWTMGPRASQPAVTSHGSSVSDANTVLSENGLKSSQSSNSVFATSLSSAVMPATAHVASCGTWATSLASSVPPITPLLASSGPYTTSLASSVVPTTAFEASGGPLAVSPVSSVPPIIPLLASSGPYTTSLASSVVLTTAFEASCGPLAASPVSSVPPITPLLTSSGPYAFSVVPTTAFEASGGPFATSRLTSSELFMQQRGLQSSGSVFPTFLASSSTPATREGAVTPLLDAECLAALSQSSSLMKEMNPMLTSPCHTPSVSSGSSVTSDDCHPAKSSSRKHSMTAVNSHQLLVDEDEAKPFIFNYHENSTSVLVSAPYSAKNVLPETPLSLPSNSSKCRCLVLGSSEDVIPSVFFVMPLYFINIFNELQTSMSSFYSQHSRGMLFAFMSESWVPGAVCCVEWGKVKGAFYRALLISSKKPTVIEVKAPEPIPEASKSLAGLLNRTLARERFLQEGEPQTTTQDNGNVTLWTCLLLDAGHIVCDVPETAIHALAPQFTTAPPLAIWCEMAFVASAHSSGEWQEDAIVLFQNLLKRSDNLVDVFLPQTSSSDDSSPLVLTQPMPVLVAIPGIHELSLNEELVLSGVAVVSGLKSPEIPAVDATESPSTPTPEPPIMSQPPRPHSLSSSSCTSESVEFDIMSQFYVKANMQDKSRKTQPRVCEYYRIRGKCGYGEECKFLHTRLPDEELSHQEIIYKPLEKDLVVMDRDQYLEYSVLPEIAELLDVCVNEVHNNLWMDTSLILLSEDCEAFIRVLSELNPPTSLKNALTRCSLKVITMELNSHYSCLPMRDENMEMFPDGSLLAVPLTVNKYARGYVLDVDEDENMLLVTLVDYGVTRRVNGNHCHALHPSFLEHRPWLGIQMKLWDSSSSSDDKDNLAWRDKLSAFVTKPEQDADPTTHLVASVRNVLLEREVVVDLFLKEDMSQVLL